MWEYNVITELRIMYKDKNGITRDRSFIILKETKHFVGYNGDVDSDESGYDDSVSLFYKQQLKKYDKIINIYSDNKWIKPDFKTKYKKRVDDFIGTESYIFSIFKIKTAQVKW